jgi:hypothetical protein
VSSYCGALDFLGSLGIAKYWVKSKTHQFGKNYLQWTPFPTISKNPGISKVKKKDR